MSFHGRERFKYWTNILLDWSFVNTKTGGVRPNAWDCGVLFVRYGRWREPPAEIEICRGAAASVVASMGWSEGIYRRNGVGELRAAKRPRHLSPKGGPRRPGDGGRTHDQRQQVERTPCGGTRWHGAEPRARPGAREAGSCGGGEAGAAAGGAGKPRDTCARGKPRAQQRRSRCRAGARTAFRPAEAGAGRGPPGTGVPHRGTPSPRISAAMADPRRGRATTSRQAARPRPRRTAFLCGGGAPRRAAAAECRRGRGGVGWVPPSYFGYRSAL